MPPSGYSKEQTGFVHNFLESVSHSLEKEGIEKDLNPSEAISAECENIRVIAEVSTDEVEKSVLFLTEAFYKKVLKEKPFDYKAYSGIVKDILLDIDDIVLSIHVPEI